MPTKPAVISELAEARARVQGLRMAGKRVGLVPTMGALHDGHLSLAARSVEVCDATIVTVFVNPTQFGPNEDFRDYPRNLENDLELLSQYPVDAVFAPSVECMYAEGASTSIRPPAVAAPLEGQCRPGHFEGVCTVVMKLFQILPCDDAFFGQKDFQQALVIRKMVEDMNVPISIHVMPTIREPDGLALSSRNRYLDLPGRQRALGLSRCLAAAERAIGEGECNAATIMATMRDTLIECGVDDIDYAVLADPDTLATLEDAIRLPLVALVAARVHKTRLIDNRLIE